MWGCIKCCMGHVTVERIENAWKKLNKAEHLVENGQTHGAVLEIENALEMLYKSADGMGEGVWFAGRENETRDKVGELKRHTVPDDEEVYEVIESAREIVRDTDDKIIPILHQRIDYEPEPDYKDYFSI